MNKLMWKNITELKENDLRVEILIPILARTLGLSQITDVHGVNEKGLDIIFFTEDSIRKTCYGLQLKRGDISGGGSRDNTVKQIIDQLNLATEFKHPVAIQPSGEYLIERFIVATNGKISSTAREEIARRINQIPVDFWDINEITKRAQKVYPELLTGNDVKLVEYLKETKIRCNTLDVLDQIIGIGTRTLSDVFVEPQIRRRFDPTLADNDILKKQIKKTPALSLKSAEHNTVIIAEQNEGKTSIFRMIAYNLSNEFLSSNSSIDDSEHRIPILLRAQNILKKGSLIEAITDYLKNANLSHMADMLVEDEATWSSYLILIDGFSELPDDELKRSCCALIERAIKSHNNIRSAIAARPDDFLHPGYFNDFFHYTIEEFSQQQVRSLVSKWTHDAVEFEDVADKMVSRVREALQLPGSPIPAIIGVMLYEKEQRYITNTAEAVDRYMVIRLGRYAQEMGIRLEVDWTRKQDLLAEIAFEMVTDGIDSIDETKTVIKLDRIYNRMGEKSKSNIVVNELVDSGILERKDGNLSFYRTAFRDFFAAHYLINKSEKFEEFFKQHLYQRKWGQVLVFAAGLRRHNNQLLRGLNQKIGENRIQISMTDRDDYIYGAYLLGRILTNSEASDEDYRIDVLRTCLYASNESANELAQEAKIQFGNVGEIAALLGTEQTLFITIGVPWLQEQFKILINDPDISEEERYLLTSVYSHLGCDNWLDVLASAVQSSKSPKVIVALLVLIARLGKDRSIKIVGKNQWENIEKMIERKKNRLGNRFNQAIKTKSKILQIEADRIKRIKGRK